MAVESHAAPDELDSPFYIENENVCKNWEAFVLARGGKVKGKYNAWSYAIRASLESNLSWVVDVKRANATNGNLFTKNIVEELIFTTTIKNTGCRNFYIGKSIFKRRTPKNAFYEKIGALVKGGVDNESLHQVRFKDSKPRAANIS